MTSIILHIPGFKASDMRADRKKSEVPSEPPSYEEAVKQARLEEKPVSGVRAASENPARYVFKPHASRGHSSFPGNRELTFGKQP